ncbi:hypothetical protein FFF34_010725 [Inquilinus sp. KBS0705]|nr:hypothetical protein FFF34_010725 [Inquilinus sp. KBS0705]
MDHFREIKNNLTWHAEGKFEVELINAVITKLNFCEPDKGPEDTGQCLTSTNYKFLRSVHSCLGELFTFIDEENKRLGYSFAREEEISTYIEETTETEYPNLTETKLRPLINYNDETEPVKAQQPEFGSSLAKNERLRNII